MGVIKTGRSGFTIFELIVVLAIISLLMAVGIPTYSRMVPDMRLKAAVRDIKSDMELAKLRAIRENTNVAFVCNTGGNSYSLFVDNGSGGGTADNWVQDGTEQLIRSVEMPEGVNMYDASFSGGVPRCRFDGRGLPNGLGGHIYMKNTKNNYRGISLSLVGHVRIQESSNGGSWTDVD